MENDIQKLWKKMADAKRRGDTKTFEILYEQWERASRRSTLRPENAFDQYPDRR